MVPILAAIPPSTGTSAPVTKDAREEARKAISDQLGDLRRLADALKRNIASQSFQQIGGVERLGIGQAGVDRPGADAVHANAIAGEIEGGGANEIGDCSF